MVENSGRRCAFSRGPSRLLNHVNFSTGRIVGLFCLLSIALSPLLIFPVKFINGAELYQLEMLRWFGERHSQALLILLGLNFGTVFIHFVMDRAVFRFSDATTRKVTAPLLFNHQ
jgi:hypothetical protein